MLLKIKLLESEEDREQWCILLSLEDTHDKRCPELTSSQVHMEMKGLVGQSVEMRWSSIPHLPSFHGFPRNRAWDKDSGRRIYLEGDPGKQKWERNECEIKGEERSHKVCHWCVSWGYRDNFTRTPEKHTECLLEPPVPHPPEGRRKDTYRWAGSHWV